MPAHLWLALDALASPVSALAQNYLPLDSNGNVQAVNTIYPDNSTLGPEYYSGTTLDFLNVTQQIGRSVEARVTVLGSAGACEFVVYQIRNGSNITASGGDPMWRFDSGGVNLAETNADGSFIAYYRNTGSIRFDMFSTTMPSNPAQSNGIFTGFDGDLSLTQHHADGCSGFVAVPEPSTLALPLLAAIGMLARRRRGPSIRSHPLDS